MGNQSLSQSKLKLSQYKLPINYYQNCHPNLLDLNIDQKYPYLLSAYITPNIQTSKWVYLIQKMTRSKYIYTPCKIIQYSSVMQQQSSSSNINNNIINNNNNNNQCHLIDKLKVFYMNDINIFTIQIVYEPYIYTLSCQISTRKRYNKLFRQRQLWKLIKYLTKMLISWHQLHPTQHITTIMPQNIIFNYKGNLRLITQYSFPKPSYHSHPYSMYIPPSDKISSIIKYTEINKFKILSDDLYCIGMVLIDCVLMEKNQQTSFKSVQAKILQIKISYKDKYTQQLIQIIETLLNQDYKKRPNPHDLVQLAVIWQNKSL